MFFQSKQRLARNFGRDWSKRRLYWTLRNKLEIEKSFRDSWIRWTSRAVQRCDEPLCHNMSQAETLAFQKKMTCYMYNLEGVSHLDYLTMPWRDYGHGISGVPGTGDWVSMINLNHFTWYQMVRKGFVLVYRCHVRGLGSDPYLLKGGYEYRWKKCIDRDVGHYTRA